MGIKGTLRKIAENLTGTRIFRKEYLKDTLLVRNLPRGIKVFDDVAKSLPNYRITVIFDVGANVGQSAKNYVALFPSSCVFCFEPIAEAYRQLELNMQGNKQVRCFQLALGASKRKGIMRSEGIRKTNHLLDESTVSTNNCKIQTEQVDILTLDGFCKSNEVDHINYLKIDTEGWDLDVLKGAKNMFIEQRIDFVEVEAGMHPNNKHHVPLESLKSYLERHGYFIFGIYSQVEEFFPKLHLRRANPVFISNQMSRNHKIN